MTMSVLQINVTRRWSNIDFLKKKKDIYINRSSISESGCMSYIHYIPPRNVATLR